MERVSPSKVSVIITINNTDIYLRESLNCILNQTLKEIELFCIVDNRLDNALNILNMYAKKDNRLVIIEKENQSIGALKNECLSMLNGIYVYFFDSKDFLDLNFLENAYKKSIQNDLDILILKSNHYDDKTKIFSSVFRDRVDGISVNNLPNKDIFSYKDMHRTVFSTFSNNIHDKFLKVKFLKENVLLFQELNKFEDFLLVNLSLVKAYRISIFDSVCVYKRINYKNQLSVYEETYLDIFNGYNLLKNKLLEINVYEDVIESFVLTLLSNSIKYLNNQKTYQQYEVVYEYIVNNLNAEFKILSYEYLFLQQRDCIKIDFENYKLITSMSFNEYLEISKKYLSNEFDFKIKISIIIPVFNVGTYLKKCLDCILTQTLKNIEVICINYGSTDDSIEILQEYASIDNRLVIITQTNQGQFKAMNKGISIAKGKYIYFLEANSVIDFDALDIMFNKVVAINADVLYFNGSYNLDSERLNQSNYFYTDELEDNSSISGVELLSKIQEKNNFCFDISLLLIKLEFLKKEDILFNENVIYMDKSFSFKLIMTSTNVTYINQKLLKKQISKNNNYDIFYGNLVSYIKIIDFINKLDGQNGIDQEIHGILNNVFNCVIDEYNSLIQFEKDKTSTLKGIELYYFKTFFVEKLQKNNIIKENFNNKDVDVKDKLQVYLWSNSNMDYSNLLTRIKIDELENLEYEVVAICSPNSWIHSAIGGFHINEKIPIISPNELFELIKQNNNYLIILPNSNDESIKKKRELNNIGFFNVIISDSLQSHNRFSRESLNSISRFNKNSEALILCSLPKTGNDTVSATFLNYDIDFIGLSHDANKLDDYFKDYSTLKIVTGVREPIIQNLSGLYQQMSAAYQNPIMDIMRSNFKDREHFFSDFENVNLLFNLTVIQRTKTNTLININSFMEDFKKNIVDLSKHTFDKEKGYSIVKEGNIEVFVYQLERMNDIVKEMSSWIGQSSFENWVRSNETNSKWISDSYKQAQKEITFTQNYFDSCYDDPWVQHFYSIEDIDKFKERWRPHIKN